MRKLTFPYCSVAALAQVLKVMRKETLPKIDTNLLRSYRIAPGNEYKVVNALRFLNLIDEEGRPTERSRLLRVKGSSGFRQIVENAYQELFQKLAEKPSSENVYNYFFTEKGLPEMARKATRVFIYLCQMAEIELGEKTRIKKTSLKPWVVNIGLAITPEIVMNTGVEELAQLFRKMKKALADSTRG